MYVRIIWRKGVWGEVGHYYTASGTQGVSPYFTLVGHSQTITESI